MKKLILSIVALAAISLTSCSSDEQTNDLQGQAQEQQVSNNTRKAALAELCSVTSTSITVTRWQAPSSVDSNWTPVSAAIGGVNVQWEGIYGASIRPTGNAAQWYVGTIALNSSCDEWDIWKANILVKNASANLGTAPTDPYNVLGYHGTISGSNYGLGYYSYDISTHIMTPARAIVIWKTSGTNSQSVTSPSSATEAYLVKVTAVTPGTSSSTISYNWTQVL
ncbi:hypothetical protein [Flavobacterium reichenbachii]|uniref:Lipoprotein n=1 Tax=Flavobacterium reichenbachii TaxID=362418 RepID=A0A085ZI63_9FLAO|nr:hypothetical protein [Flavobacterium reichenbachii]KFF04127.1 hypothetical protein IW19_00660 [Flavobacterium reichenbachii]OXB15832.1 hypothetical protein B0A68_09205 [Flavobacterium reichenbachii]